MAPAALPAQMADSVASPAQRLHGLHQMPDARFYRRDLPHWRVEGACYFVTFRVNRKQTDLAFEERTVVQETLLYRAGTTHRLDAHVIMNDHVHVLVWPGTQVRLE
ncbi:MAG: hypothetical protein ACREOE_12510, partial [Gemmatimonadales bacterium]